MPNQVAKVKRERIASCMTCPICNKFFRDATTISECLHTFCRKCIHEKLSDDEFDCCPVCNINLGCLPLEKLRPDHSLQDVRAKIFPFKRRKVKAPEFALPVRRKERSLSSLGVSAPLVPTETAMTGRRSKAVVRKLSSLRGLSFSNEKSAMIEEDSGEDNLESSSSPATLKMVTGKARQLVQNSAAGPCGDPAPDNETEVDAKTWEAKVDLWKPLNCLVEAANRSKWSKFSSQGSAARSETLHPLDSEASGRKTKVKKHCYKSTVQDGDHKTDHVSSETVKPRKQRRIQQKRVPVFGESGISAQAAVDAATGNYEKIGGPIWFSLMASADQKGDASLPQISASYLRVKSGNVPVSFIQKYLMSKLDLASEDEVEISCMGQSLLPTLQINNLIEFWLQTAPTSQRVPVFIGSSAKDFVMVLGYARKFSTS